MKILLTGHKGFIGSYLKSSFELLGCEVFGVDKKDGAEFDITNLFSLIGIFEQFKPDIVCHHAASVSVPESIKNPRDHWFNNVEGTTNVLEAMRITKTNRIIFASSSSVYGSNAKKNVIENDAIIADQLSPYAASKAICEKLIETYSKVYGIKYINLRYFNVFGKGGRGVIAKWNERKKAIETQNGNTERDYTHISNIEFANVAALEASESAWNDVYNIGCGKTTSLTNLAALMGVETEEKQSLDCDVQCCSANVHKAKKLLKYQVITELKEGLKLI